jgi:hypothetical protein
MELVYGMSFVAELEDRFFVPIYTSFTNTHNEETLMVRFNEH